MLALPLLAVPAIAIFGWNWARGPLQRLVLEKTGRELVIAGELTLSPAWPAPRLRAQAVTFANPAWAREKQMVAVDEVEFTLDLLELFRKNLEFPEVRLTRPVVYLEVAADGRKTWLLDPNQSKETARIPIGRLTLDKGRLGYDDLKQQTSIRSDISTQAGQAGGPAGVVFTATGLYRGAALSAHGSAGSVLALHDESVPFPLKVDAKFGGTRIEAEGSITSLLKFTALDMRLALRGESLALLYPLFKLPFPDTHAYATTGDLVHSGRMWRYDKFSGHIGKSDIAGSFQVDLGGTRPFLSGQLASKLLDLDDLGPLIGARDAKPVGAANRVAKSDTPKSGTPKSDLRGPIHVGGTFSDPTFGLDKGRIAMRGAGALALGLINPLLALVPLVEMGPGAESQCGALMRKAKAPLQVAARKPVFVPVPAKGALP